MIKMSADDSKKASTILGRLDKVAETIQANHEEWGMPFEQAKDLVNTLDVAADDFESMTFGGGSLEHRQMEVLASDKKAEVLQRDADEPYMDSFKSTEGVVQSDADEPYMSAYGDDQSSAVVHGKSTNGQPLT